MPAATFSKPPHLGPLAEGLEALEDACAAKFSRLSSKASPPPQEWMHGSWRLKVQVGYERMTQTLWRVAREFDVRGYGSVLRDKLTAKWCDCGCSTDHLGEVCERTVREDEQDSGVRPGKQREWDGRGSGVYGWETEEEEDIWEMPLDFGGVEPPEDCDDDMTVGELMELRYIRAEREKEEGNVAFRKGLFDEAVGHYETAHKIEPEMPHYQLNLAAAYLKLNNWIEAEKACTKALSQHRSSKGYFRRARARKMLGRFDEAVKDVRAILRLQPDNTEAMAELALLVPPKPTDTSSTTKLTPATSSSSSSSSANPIKSSASSSSKKQPKQLPFARTKADDRKLKISLLPLGAFDSRNEHQHHELCPEHGYHGHTHSHSHTSSGKQPQSGNTNNGGSVPHRQHKDKRDNADRETLPFPSWDRYVVRKAD